MEWTKKIVIRINNLLREKELSVYKLCKNANILQPTMNKILTGITSDINYSTICQIADGFGITVKEFFNDDIFD